MMLDRANVEHVLRDMPRNARIAIVGSMNLNGDRSRQLVRDVFDVLMPSSVVSGGAPGIDTLVAEEAAAREIAMQEHKPKVPGWRDGYMPRNLLIAQSCDGLVRIALKESRTYGSGWTRDRAREMGKPTAEFVL